MKLYLVRHAPVKGKKGVIYGDDAEIDMNDQSDAILALSTQLPSPQEADWYSSGVDRAYRSGEAVLLEMGSHYKAEAIIGKHAGFREQNFGSLIGKAHDEVHAYVQFVDGKILTLAPPGGESVEEFVERVAEGIEGVKEAAKKNQKENIVVFCHGGTIRAAHVAINKLNHRDFIALDTPPLAMHSYDISNF